MFYFSKESKPKYDLKPTSAEHNSDWHTEFCEFYKEYIPRPVPNKVLHPYDEYFQKVAAARKRRMLTRRELPFVDRSNTTVPLVTFVGNLHVSPKSQGGF